MICWLRGAQFVDGEYIIHELTMTIASHDSARPLTEMQFQKVVI
jgi:hypothetical protein